MGLLAVVDTFLIYKIAERRYNRNVAFIASILFAVMPLGWMVRNVFLESIQMPFLLTSIFLAVYYSCRHANKISGRSNSNNFRQKNDKDSNRNIKNTSLILLSGAFLGLAIFTKIPVFTMIPLVGFLIYTNSNKNLKSLGLWFIPVILIPLIWPAHAMLIGDLDMWFKGIFWQTTERDDKPLVDTLFSMYKRDPVLLTLGVAGLLFTATIKKDFIYTLGTISFLILLYLIGYVSSFHLIPIIPLLCIAAAVLIADISTRISNKRRTSIQKVLPIIIVTGIGAFGFISTSIIISKNINSAELEASAIVSQQLPGKQKQHDAPTDTTLIANPTYGWILQYIFDKDYQHRSYYSSKQIDTEKFIMIKDGGFDRIMSGDGKKAQVLNELLDKSNTVATFYDDIAKNKGRIDIRSN